MIRFLFLPIFFLSIHGIAQNYVKQTDNSRCKQKINEKAKNTTSISADFNEEIFSSMLKHSTKTKGILRYKKENKIRWEHISPKKQVILIDGKTLRYSEDGKEIKNAGTNRVVKKIQGLMMQMFNGDFLNEKDFTVYYYENSMNYQLILIPKNSRMANYISSIELVFDKNTLEMKKLTLKESEEDKIVYTFTNIVFNKEIKNTTFTQF